MSFVNGRSRSGRVGFDGEEVSAEGGGGVCRREGLPAHTKSREAMTRHGKSWAAPGKQGHTKSREVMARHGYGFDCWFIT